MVVLLDMFMYDVDVPQRFTYLRGLTTVAGVSNRYFVPRLRVWRYAVFEEADCPMSPDVAVSLGRDACVSAFGDDCLGMVVRTKHGYHYYLDRFTQDFMGAVLDACRFRSYLPASCRDLRHVRYALRVVNELGVERYVLRVSPTKHGIDLMRVVHFKGSRDPYHNEFLKEVGRMVGFLNI